MTTIYLKTIIHNKREGAWWHPGAKVWSVYDNRENRHQLKEIFKE